VLPVTGFWLNVHVTLAGQFTLIVTAPVKPPVRVIVTV